MTKEEKINKAIFLDRDGIINHVVYHKDTNKPSSPRTIEEFRLINGIKKHLYELTKKGFLLFVISNQPDISRGKIKNGTTEEINKIIYEKFPIKEIKVCPHDDKDNCTCRKPKPGMIFELAEKWDVDLSKSYLIGDNWKDIKAGNAAGVKSILINRDYNKDVKSKYRAESLEEAIKLINI